jgi:hypothetical protein
MASPADLITSVRRSHEGILSLIDQTGTVVRIYSQARNILRDLEEHLSAHLRRQDREFYQRLKDHYAQERESLKMIEFLVHDLKEIKIKSLIFFEKHATNTGNLAAARFFPRDFMEFKEAIINRIKIEEEYLIPLLFNMPKEE